MARIKAFAHQGRYALEFALGCLSFACFAAAQSNSSKTDPVIVDRKDASNLILNQTKPDYPALAKVNYIQGRVRMRLLVSSQGRVVESNVIEGHPFLAVAALSAVHEWVYRPLQSPAGPVPFVTMVEVNFALRNIQPQRFPPEPVKDLNRQVRPPQVLDRPSAQLHLVHLRVLVSENGQAIDVNPVNDFPSQYDSAMRMAGHFRFQPARWGSITVPWYLDVEVPTEGPPPSVPASND